MIIHLHGDLPTLLPRARRGETRVQVPMSRRAAIKDVIEALDIPHTEVERILADGREVAFAHICAEAEVIEVYPVTAPVDLFTPTLLRPRPIPRIAFVVDQNVGKLAPLLRLAGFDALYHHGIADPEVARISQQSRRILLSKDRDLLKRKAIEFGHLVREIIPEHQLAEVLTLFGIQGQAQPFSRCLRCNAGILEPVAKELILERLEPLTRQYYDAFFTCTSCQRIFWEGTHVRRMEGMLARLGLGECMMPPLPGEE